LWFGRFAEAGPVLRVGGGGLSNSVPDTGAARKRGIQPEEQAFGGLGKLQRGSEAPERRADQAGVGADWQAVVCQLDARTVRAVGKERVPSWHAG